MGLARASITSSAMRMSAPFFSLVSAGQSTTSNPSACSAQRNSLKRARWPFPSVMKPAGFM